MNNESIAKTFGVATALCRLRDLVSVPSVALKGVQERNAAAR